MSSAAPAKYPPRSPAAAESPRAEPSPIENPPACSDPRRHPACAAALPHRLRRSDNQEIRGASCRKTPGFQPYKLSKCRSVPLPDNHCVGAGRSALPPERCSERAKPHAARNGRIMPASCVALSGLDVVIMFAQGGALRLAPLRCALGWFVKAPSGRRTRLTFGRSVHGGWFSDRGASIPIGHAATWALYAGRIMNDEVRITKETAERSEMCSAKRSHRPRKRMAENIKSRKVNTLRVQMGRRCESRRSPVAEQSHFVVRRRAGRGNADWRVEEVVRAQSSAVSSVFSGDPQGSALQLRIADFGLRKWMRKGHEVIPGSRRRATSPVGG